MTLSRCFHLDGTSGGSYRGAGGGRKRRRRRIGLRMKWLRSCGGGKRGGR